MSHFQLDPRLTNDCFHLGQLLDAELLLMNNALYPWLILVPHSAHTEFYELNTDEQTVVLSSINRLSSFTKQYFASEKLNIATIGNIVSQLHIHIIGRSQSDIAWPGTVWGKPGREAYTSTAVADIRAALIADMGDNFISRAQ